MSWIPEDLILSRRELRKINKKMDAYREKLNELWTDEGRLKGEKEMSEHEGSKASENA